MALPKLQTPGSRSMNCPQCKQLIDTTDIDPGTPIQCPSCSAKTAAVWTMGPYLLTRRVASGGMGTIYEAIDSALSRVVAIKILHPNLASDHEFITSFAREAEITASINHPNVVQVYHFGKEGEAYYLAMELIQHGSLDDYMTRVGALGEVETLDIGIQAARGLQEAHAHGLLHRDVKPGNILFGPNRMAKLVDFGLSLPVDDARRNSGEVWGTPYYVAPEKLEQKGEDQRSDIYSLGGTLFHAMAGRPPFEAQTASLVAWKHLKSEKVSLKAFAPTVTDETAFVINKSLERDPDRRFQSYGEMITALEGAKKKALAKPAQGRVNRDITGSKSEASMTLWFTLGAIGIIVVLLGLFLLLKDRLLNPRDPLEDARVPAAAVRLIG